MRHRANVIGARLTVDSRRGEGVVVRCSLNSPAR
jgi:signal transduction histidine kinase